MANSARHQALVRFVYQQSWQDQHITGPSAKNAFYNLSSNSNTNITMDSDIIKPIMILSGVGVAVMMCKSEIVKDALTLLGVLYIVIWSILNAGWMEVIMSFVELYGCAIALVSAIQTGFQVSKERSWKAPASAAKHHSDKAAQECSSIVGAKDSVVNEEPRPEASGGSAASAIQVSK